jgi:hypothetical protein
MEKYEKSQTWSEEEVSTDLGDGKADLSPGKDVMLLNSTWGSLCFHTCSVQTPSSLVSLVLGQKWESNPFMSLW